MRRLTTICLLALSAVALLVAAPGASAAPKGPQPKITKVSPMRVSVGALLTIRGQHFRSKARRNTVIFRASNGRTAFAKPRRASRNKLVVRVPAAVARLLTVRASSQRPTRLKLRVLAGRFSEYTSRRLSPVVTGVSGEDGSGEPPKVCKDDGDHDNDLLSNDLETQVGLDPCLEDTDQDTMSDGWEYYSAKDLNVKAVPYPGKRPFPNALDPSDGSSGKASQWDFDGDGLTTKEEYRAWRRSGSSFASANIGGLDLLSPLGYSDGTKFSRANDAPVVPAWRSSNYGLPNPPQPFPSTYQLFPDPEWRDSERDADADGMANWLEAAKGPSNNAWWEAFWANDRQFSPAVEAWGEAFYCATVPSQSPGYFDERPFENLDLADSDVDGDSLLDGEDDQDADGYTNITEVYETQKDLDGNGQPAWCGYGAGIVPTIDRGGDDWAINPFNPCAPNPLSRTCDDFVPF